MDMNRLSVEDFRRSPKTPLIVVLDNVRSLHNVGSVLRTADAFRLQEVLLCGITACPPQPEIHKTALGAEDSVAWRHLDSTLEAVQQLRSDGYTVLAVEQAAGSVSLERLTLRSDGRYALVLGHEVRGVDQAVVDACDGCIEIPQFGTKHSLNVSVAAGLVIWDFFKQLGIPQ